MTEHTDKPTGPTLPPSPPRTTLSPTEQSAADQRALDDLEAEMTHLWGHISAAKCRFLELVAEFDRREGWGRHGCASCAHWLNWQCGIGMVAAREQVRVARALHEFPQIHDAFRNGRISYSKVRALTRIATPENESALMNIALHGTANHVERVVSRYRRVERLEDAQRAEAVHQSRRAYWRWDEDGSMTLVARFPAEVGEIVRKALREAIAIMDDADVPEDSEVSSDASAEACSRETKRADALRLLAERFLTDRSAQCGVAADRMQVVVHVDQQLLADAPDIRESREHPPAPRCELEDGPPLAVDTARRLACDASVVGIVENSDGEPLNIGRRTRTIPPALRRALAARDGGCRFPGCTHIRFTEGHHVKHWADGGETSLSNLVTLCRYHHRLIHEGGFGVRVTDDGVFVFTRPNGTRIAARRRTVTGADGMEPGAGDPGLAALNRSAGVGVDAGTIRCRWGGESMDYHHAIGALVGLRDRAAQVTPPGDTG